MLSKIQRYTRKLNIGLDWFRIQILRRDEAYKNNYVLKEYKNGIKEVDWIAEDIVLIYVKYGRDLDFDSAKDLMRAAEDTLHYYNGDKYKLGLLEDIMRDQLSNEFWYIEVINGKSFIFWSFYFFHSNTY